MPGHSSAVTGAVTDLGAPTAQTLSCVCRLFSRADTPRQGIAAELEHPGHRRRMALVCSSWAGATPVTSLDVVLHKGLGLSELRARLAALTLRHPHLSSLRFRCASTVTLTSDPDPDPTPSLSLGFMVGLNLLCNIPMDIGSCVDTSRALGPT